MCIFDCLCPCALACDGDGDDADSKITTAADFDFSLIYESLSVDHITSTVEAPPTEQALWILVILAFGYTMVASDLVATLLFLIPHGHFNTNPLTGRGSM